jgi:hypothetical protein
MNTTSNGAGHYSTVLCLPQVFMFFENENCNMGIGEIWHQPQHRQRVAWAAWSVHLLWININTYQQRTFEGEEAASRSPRACGQQGTFIKGAWPRNQR